MHQVISRNDTGKDGYAEQHQDDQQRRSNPVEYFCPGKHIFRRNRQGFAVTPLAVNRLAQKK